MKVIYLSVTYLDSDTYQIQAKAIEEETFILTNPRYI